MIIILVSNRMQINNRSSITDPSWLMLTVFLSIPLSKLHLSHTSSPSAGRCFKCPLALFQSLSHSLFRILCRFICALI